MIDRRTVLGSLASLISAAAFAKPAKPATLTIYKSPYCGCCSGWVAHVKASGIAVRVRDMEDVTPVAKRLGVPDTLRSCHTGEIAGYFVEGHVPASDIRKLLRDRPKARGIAVPGMPTGSPGMEQVGRGDAYDTVQVDHEGTVSIFARHNRATGRG